MPFRDWRPFTKPLLIFEKEISSIFVPRGYAVLYTISRFGTQSPPHHYIPAPTSIVSSSSISSSGQLHITSSQQCQLPIYTHIATKTTTDTLLSCIAPAPLYSVHTTISLSDPNKPAPPGALYQPQRALPRDQPQRALPRDDATALFN